MKRFVIISLSASIAIGILPNTKLDPRSTLLLGMQQATEKVISSNDTLNHALHKIIKSRKDSKLSQPTYDIFITLSEELDIATLESMGISDVVLFGTTAIGTVTESVLAQLNENDKVLSISFSGTASLHCDRARKDTGVDIIRAGEDELPQGYTGKGVIVSLFDNGIETSHINFLDKERKENRIRKIWKYETTQDQTGKITTEEQVFETPEEIAEFKTDDQNQTHGTHTLGIMTGSFGTGGEDPEHDYSGMAPESDILIGCGSISYSNVAKSIVRFKEYAEEKNQPLVINLSLGDNIGPHDGTDAFPRVLNQLAENTPIFISSGNEGRNKIALNKTFSEFDSQIRTVIVPRNTIRNYLGTSWEAACEVQVWSEDETPFTVQTGFWDKEEEKWVFLLPTAPDGQAAYIANGAYKEISNYQNDDFDYLYKDSAIGISTGYDPNNHRYTADIWYMLDKQINHIDRNIVPVLIVKGQNGKRVDIYCDGDYNEFGTGKMSGWDDGMSDGSISNIACGENTIAVGAYCTRLILDPSIEGEVSDFSSWGVLPDGRVLPDVLAPGDHIVSSMSTPFTATEYYTSDAYPAVYGLMYGEDNPFYWTLLQGTSQAAPAMAGIAALWLQANPKLTPQDIKRIAKNTANPTSNMTRNVDREKLMP